MGDPQQQPLQRKKPSWVPTLVAQASLCCAIYAVFNISMPPRTSSPNYATGTGSGSFSDWRFVGRSHDLYFITVRGGSRPLVEQTQLLQQMDMAARIFKVKFVLDLSEVGENDPLLQNVSLSFQSLKVPWYTTRASERQEGVYFLKQITISHEKTIDILFLDTGSLQMEQASESRRDQMHWLTRTLAESSSHWRVIVGFHPLMDCAEEQHTTKNNLLHHIFLKHSVNAYVSKLGCAGHYTQHSGIAYIGNPSHEYEEFRTSSANANFKARSEMLDGFLLHRVSLLEIESYFINSEGNVISRYTIQQRGREAM